MDLATAKAEINSRLDLEVMGEAPRIAPDRLVDDASLKTVVDKLALDGWTITKRTKTDIELSRIYVVRRTRTPEHQAAAEKAREVTVGDNTYETTVKQVRHVSIPTVYGRIEGDALSGVEVTDEVSALAIVALYANTSGPRPADRLRDL